MWGGKIGDHGSSRVRTPPADQDGTTELRARVLVW